MDYRYPNDVESNIKELMIHAIDCLFLALKANLEHDRFGTVDALQLVANALEMIDELDCHFDNPRIRETRGYDSLVSDYGHMASRKGCLAMIRRQFE